MACEVARHCSEVGSTWLHVGTNLSGQSHLAAPAHPRPTPGLRGGRPGVVGWHRALTRVGELDGPAASMAARQSVAMSAPDASRDFITPRSRCGGQLELGIRG